MINISKSIGLSKAAENKTMDDRRGARPKIASAVTKRQFFISEHLGTVSHMYYLNFLTVKINRNKFLSQLVPIFIQRLHSTSPFLQKQHRLSPPSDINKCKQNFAAILLSHQRNLSFYLKIIKKTLMNAAYLRRIQKAARKVQYIGGRLLGQRMHRALQTANLDSRRCKNALNLAEISLHARKYAFAVNRHANKGCNHKKSTKNGAALSILSTSKILKSLFDRPPSLNNLPHG
ncbi:unnamed protein product [Ceratitis capitata]|uniref:(Mediterranean fruit fly) hypothetical protein n=1 Tax=Ceratitis capitata TaxID=7213 RepID=A0A811VCN8_CERCA|nr:unnamed protein product [Ceratitis capitata]